MKLLLLALCFCLVFLQVSSDTLIFEETWDDLDFDRWQHELTMSGGGNWEFQVSLFLSD